MNKVAGFVFGTAYGSFVAWCSTALFLFTAVAVSPMLGKFWTALVKAMLIVQAVAAFAGAIAFFISLNEREWLRAAGQFCLGVVGLSLFVLGLGVSLVAGWSVASATSSGYGPEQSASVTNETGALEFAVEYRPAHPFLAEYDKCIVFPSGKRIGVWMDTGGAGAFAVYRLPTGEYYLVDGLECDFIRNDYRVNTTNETVEMMYGETWIEIPEGSQAVTGGGVSSSNGENRVDLTVRTADGEKSVSGGMPVGDSLKGRSYLGLLHPRGRFEPGDGDPFADIIEPKWKPVKLYGGEAPFSLECKRWKDSRYYRLVQASGARIALDYSNCTGDKGYSLFALENGRYHLFEVQQKDVLWRREWRIDAAGEEVEVMFKDHWGKYGDLWVKLPLGSISYRTNVGVSGGNDGKPLSVSITVNTENGRMTGHDFIPVGDSLSNAKFIGTFRPPDDDPRPRIWKRKGN